MHIGNEIKRYYYLLLFIMPQFRFKEDNYMLPDPIYVK